MRNTLALFIPLLWTFLLTGPLSCGNLSEPELQQLLQEAQRIELQILNGSASLHPGETLKVRAMALDSQGQEIPGASFSYDALDGRVATVLASGEVHALYPGETSIVATSGAVSSDPLAIKVLPPPNSQTTRALTDNQVEDNWGEFTTQNWSTISKGKILWLQDDANGFPFQLILGDLQGNEQVLRDFTGTNVDNVDFLALGSGSDGQSRLASWREDMNQTWVGESTGTPNNLGDQIQEENSIAEGCLFFRRGLPDNDIYMYDARDRMVRLVADQGNLSDPITSGCQVVYLKDGELVLFDGKQSLPVAPGPLQAGDFDFRGNRIVYAQGGDVHTVDTAVQPLASQALTSDGAQNANPKTDGHSVVWFRGPDDEVRLYDAISNRIRTISLNASPKEDLQIDFKQVLYLEGNRLFFHDGSGDPVGTVEIPLPSGFTLNNFFRAYLSEGVAALVGNDGDDEVLVFE